MTDEELKKSMNLDFIKGLKLGLVPDRDFRDKYTKARNDNTLTSSLDELEELSKRMNESKDISGFTKDIFKRLNDISDMLYNDSYFSRSIGNEEFTKSLNEVRNSFNIAGDFLTNEKVLSTCEEDLAKAEALLQEARKNRLAIQNDSSLSFLDQSIKLAEANIVFDTRQKELEEARRIRNEQKAKLDESLKEIEKNLNIDEFVNNILQSVNKLDLLYRTSGLALNAETSEKLGISIRDLRDEVIGFRREALADEMKFREIMESVGLTKVTEPKEVIENKIKELEAEINDLNKEEKLDEVMEETPVVEPISPTPSPAPQPLEPEKESEKPVAEVTITTVEELAKEMKLLNSHLEISTDEKGFVDGIIYDGESKLVLPKEFSYDKILGINNKVDDKQGYISLPVKVKEKTLTSNEPTKPVEPTKTSEGTRKVEPGKKYKVKKIRRAVVAPYVKATLGFAVLAGVGSLLAGAGLAPFIPAAGIGAGIGALGQAIYNKMAKAGIVDKESEEQRQNDPKFEEDTWGKAAFQGLIAKGKDLFEKLKFAKERKNSEPKVQQPSKPVEAPVEKEPEVEEKKEETLDKPEERLNFEEVFNQRINEMFPEDKQEKPLLNEEVLPNINGEVYPLEQSDGRGGR